MRTGKVEDEIDLAKKGKADELLLWLKDGNSPDCYDKDGWTPLLWAAARGHDKVVSILLDNAADIRMPHKISGALAIHMAGHSGSVATVKTILDRRKEDINAVWDLNGHTVLLQAAFYGHLELADFLVKLGADTSITTARGLGAMEMAEQFQNKEMMEIIRPYDSSVEKKAGYYKTYLARIAPVVPDNEKELQKVADELVYTIENGIKMTFSDAGSVEKTLEKINDLITVKRADVNRLGGPLQQPPLVVTVTGNNGFPTNERAAYLRKTIAEILLKNGADPTLHEMHPMGAQTIIRGAVFNHLEILKMCSEYITPRALTDAINEYPVVNGLTALHDTVLRATMASDEKFEGYLAQAKWFMEHGGRSDIEDFAGRTQKDIAENCKREEIRRRLLEVL